MKILTILALFPAILLADDISRHDLDWLVGCWQTTDGKAQEVWVLDGEDMLAGFAVSISDDAVRFYEVLTIRRDENGVLIYTAHPSGQATTSFIGMEFTDNGALFVNADHDYPQAIRYARSGSDLVATISRLDGSRENTFAKVACDQP